MRVVSVVLVILGCVGRIAAQCDSSIGPADTVASVKKKLACIAAENEKLRQALANFTAENDKLKQDVTNANALLKGQLRIHWVGGAYQYDKFTPKLCLSKFSDALIKRGGIFLQGGDTWLDYQLGEDAVSIDCKASSTGYVIVSGRDHSRIAELGKK